MTSRNDEIRERCQAYHNKYPEVWDKFVEFTFDRISKGYKHYSSNAIFERIRWEMDGVGADGKTTITINDHYTPFYARRFHKIYKDHDGFFITREQPSKKREATGLDELGPDDFPMVKWD